VKQILIGPDADLAALRLPFAPVRLQPILEILPIEMLTIAMAASAGFKAGSFVHGSKITMDE
jgi:glucosamine--fructose-6-phosphate aminotransferase (isomerizing)